MSLAARHTCHIAKKYGLKLGLRVGILRTTFGKLGIISCPAKGPSGLERVPTYIPVYMHPGKVASQAGLEEASGWDQV